MDDSLYNVEDDPLRERVDPMLPEGTTVGDYVVDSPIGEGGFGTVYSATHPMIGKRAAVKVLNKDLSRDSDMVSRFVAEARAVNTIRHQNIVDIFNIGMLEDGRHYFVMELLNGESLEDVLSNRIRVDPPELLEIMRGVTGALDAAHDKGIVHRDIKPDNIFLHREPNGNLTPKLVDFGVAKLTGESESLSHHQTATGAPIGTPRYMAPEQCFAKDIDPRTDIYALGVVCYEALTGVAPFDADSLLMLMNKHTLADRPNASDACPALGRAFDDVLKSMMSIDPLERPQSAGEAFQLLEAAATGRPSIPTQRLGSMTMEAGNASPIDQAPPAPRSHPESAPRGVAQTELLADGVRFDDAITLPTPPHGVPAAKMPHVAAISGASPLALRKPTTLGATSAGVTRAHGSSRRMVWIVASLLAVTTAVIGLMLTFSGESSSSDVVAEPAPSNGSASSPTVGAPSPTATVDLEPSTAPSTEPSSAPAESPSASASAAPVDKPPPRRRRRRPVVRPTPAPPPPPPPPKPAQPDPFDHP